MCRGRSGRTCQREHKKTPKTIMENHCEVHTQVRKLERQEKGAFGTVLTFTRWGEYNWREITAFVQQRLPTRERTVTGRLRRVVFSFFCGQWLAAAVRRRTKHRDKIRLCACIHGCR